MLDSIRELSKQMSLKQMVIDAFIAKEETQKVGSPFRSRPVRASRLRSGWVPSRTPDGFSGRRGTATHPDF